MSRAHVIDLTGDSDSEETPIQPSAKRQCVASIDLRGATIKSEPVPSIPAPRVPVASVPISTIKSEPATSLANVSVNTEAMQKPPPLSYAEQLEERRLRLQKKSAENSTAPTSLSTPDALQPIALPSSSSSSTLPTYKPANSAMGYLTAAAAPTYSSLPLSSLSSINYISILSQNVWFESVALEARMKGIGDLITREQPTVIFMQEVTPDISQKMFRAAPWSHQYYISDDPQYMPYFTLLCILKKITQFKPKFERKSFSSSVQGRDLLYANLDLGFGMKVVVATSHLESYVPGNPGLVFRQKQLAEVRQIFDNLGVSAAIFGGDLNWDNKDGNILSFLPGWTDAWLSLNAEDEGYTYNGSTNKMLTNRIIKRLDRIMVKNNPSCVCEEIRMVGTEPIPNVTYLNEKKQTRLPVFNSDHYGLFLRIKLPTVAGRALA